MNTISTYHLYTTTGAWLSSTTNHDWLVNEAIPFHRRLGQKMLILKFEEVMA